MARPLSTFLSSYLSDTAGAAASLVEITLTNNTVKRFGTYALTIGADYYDDYLIKVGEIEEIEGASVDKVTLQLSNVDKLIGLDVLAGLYTLADCSVKRFHQKADGTFEVAELFWGKIIPIETDNRHVYLDCIDAIIAGDYVAVWTLAVECENKFKDTVCGYTGTETVCNKQLRGDCTKYANTHRFRGVPILERIPETDKPPSEPPTDSGGNPNGGWGSDGNNLWRDGNENWGNVG